MKKIICIILFIVSLFSFTACGGVNLKTDELATKTQVKNLIENTKEGNGKDFSVEFTYEHEELRLSSSQKVEFEYSIEGTASYKYDSNLKIYVLTAIEFNGDYEFVKYIPSISKTIKETIEVSEKGVAFYEDLSVAYTFIDYSGKEVRDGTVLKDNKKAYCDPDYVFGKTEEIVKRFVNKNFFFNVISQSKFVFLSGKEVFGVLSSDIYQMEAMFEIKNDVLKRTLVENTTKDEHFIADFKYVDYVEIEEPKDKSEYEGFNEDGRK